jgi:hypothetical protein
MIIRRALVGAVLALPLAVLAACTSGGSGPAPAAGSPGASPTAPAGASPPVPGPAPAAVAIPTCGPVSIPPFRAADFPRPTTIDNRWFPLVPGSQVVLEGRANRGGGVLPHQIVSTVTDLIKVINGVPTVVVWEVDRDQGTLAESELAFFAQDRDGNVWNFGQYPELYTGGLFTGAPKTWLAGVAGADAGVLVRGRPQPGSVEFLQGAAPEVDFLDCAKEVQTGERTCVPTGCYDDVLVVDERSGEDPASGVQRKYYAPGVGGVRVEAIGDPEAETLVLVRVSTPNPATLARARQEALALEKHAYQISPVYRQSPPAQPRQ